MSNVTKETVADWFGIGVDELAKIKFIYGYYSYEDYSGEAFVLFEKGGKLYEVNGSHCSCYGLEGQWQPEETLIAAIEKRLVDAYGFYQGNRDEIRDSLKRYNKNVVRRARYKRKG